jgi:hypothetical protein
MGLTELVLTQALLLGAGLGIVRARLGPGEARLTAYTLVTLVWLGVQLIGWGAELFYGGLG